MVVRAPADSYTLLYCGNADAVNTTMYETATSRAGREHGAEFAKVLAEETEKWGKVIRTAAIKPT